MIVAVKVQDAPCVRLFTNTGSVGCRVTDREGSSLPLFPIYASDFPGLAALRSYHSKVDVVLGGDLFNASTLALLDATNHLGGLLVLANTLPDFDDKDGRYSHDSTMPQGTVAWNPRGNGLLLGDYDYPISLVVNDEECHNLVRWSAENRATGMDSMPAWIADRDYYFGRASLTSESCLRWRDRDGTLDPKCMPLGGHSLWGTAGPRDERPVVLAAAGMDSSSLFHEASYGAKDAVASIVTLMLAADALSRHQDVLSTAPRQVCARYLALCCVCRCSVLHSNPSESVILLAASPYVPFRLLSGSFKEKILASSGLGVLSRCALSEEKRCLNHRQASCAHIPVPPSPACRTLEAHLRAAIEFRTMLARTCA